MPLTNEQLRSLIESKALAVDTSTLNRRSTYAGKYIVQSFGLPGYVVQLYDAKGELSGTFMGNTFPLTEVEPGLFFSSAGDAMDLRGKTPMMANIHLIKANSQKLIFRTTLYSICGLVFLISILFWPIRALIRIIRRTKTTEVGSAQNRSTDWTASAHGLTVFASLLSLICLGLVAVIPNFIYFRWPTPYPELEWWQIMLFYLPYVSLVLAAMAGVITGLIFKKQTLKRFILIYLLMLAAVVFAFNLALLI